MKRPGAAYPIAHVLTLSVLSLLSGLSVLPVLSLAAVPGCGRARPALSGAAGEDGGAAGGNAGTPGIGGTGGTPGTGGGAAGSGGLGGSGGPGVLGAREPNRGPGIPRTSLAADALFKVCAPVNGGDTDQDHHNTVTMYDGYLFMPWAHEAGGGGISFYDISQPCAPQRIGSGTSDEIRETHTMAISDVAGGRWFFAAQRTVGGPGGGIQVWNIADVTAPRAVAKLDLEGHAYPPNGYDYVVMAIAPQGRYLYVAAGFLGVFVIDVADPLHPVVVSRFVPTPAMRIMQVIAVGNLLFTSAAGGSRVILLDIADPIHPQPIPGGDFEISASGGAATNAYSSNFSGGYAYFARQSGTGGLVIYDLRDPRQPRLAGAYDDAGGNGGYVFIQEPFAFVGNSNFYSIYDLSDHGTIQLVSHLSMKGDQDTITPIGHLAVLSVDDSAERGAATGIAPWAREPDTKPPVVTWSYPSDGATAVALSSRIGVTFGEAVDIKSAWRPGAVRLYPAAGGPGAALVVRIDVIDTVLNVSPGAPLAPETQYTLEVVPGGVEDLAGNAVVQGFSMSFTTGS